MTHFFFTTKRLVMTVYKVITFDYPAYIKVTNMKYGTVNLDASLFAQKTQNGNGLCV